MKNLYKYLNKLTLFDKAIILISVFTFLFFGYYFFRKPTFISAVIKVNSDTVKFEPWRLNMGTSSWFEQFFHTGMREVNGLGKTMAEVVDIYSYDSGPAFKSVYITTKLNAVYNRATGQYTFKGRPLIVGNIVKLNLDKAYVEGLVTFIEGSEDKREKKRLKLEAQLIEYNQVYQESEGVRKTLSDSIKVGDVVIDSRGNNIVKISEKRVTEAKRIVPTADGRVVVSVNPQRVEVYLTLDVEVYKLDDKYFLFDDIPVLIGQSIPINTSTYSIYPEVTKITVLE